MEAQFWHDRWTANEIGFHEANANQLLVDHFQVLGLSKGARVFVPLCGKSNDIAWILSQGHHVIGAELSQIAIEDLFAALGVQPQITQVGQAQKYSGPMIDIFVGDILELRPADLGAVDAVYDRAALVAMPGHMRVDYARQVATLTENAPQLVICFGYDQSLMDGPPFSVDDAGIALVYGDTYKLTRVSDRPSQVRDISVKETIWHLT